MTTVALLSLWEKDSVKGVLQHLWELHKCSQALPFTDVLHFALPTLQLAQLRCYASVTWQHHPPGWCLGMICTAR
jgi:hypothetical protein